LENVIEAAAAKQLYFHVRLLREARTAFKWSTLIGTHHTLSVRQTIIFLYVGLARTVYTHRI